MRINSDYWIPLSLFGGMIVLLLILALIGTSFKVNVWNKCHPNTPITFAEAFWTSVDIVICEGDQTREEP